MKLIESLCRGGRDNAAFFSAFSRRSRHREISLVASVYVLFSTQLRHGLKVTCLNHRVKWSVSGGGGRGIEGWVSGGEKSKLREQEKVSF